MNHLKPAGIAFVAILLVMMTALHAESNLLQRSISAAMFGETAEEQAELGALDLTDDLERVDPQPPKTFDSETLWLARVIYSETKKPHEQKLVAWVVRNRVETEFRGNSTYREVVLDPYQFSAFNPGTRTRSHYASLDKDANKRGWQTALEIAQEVRHYPESERPFSVNTRHFFSERSMVGRSQPRWADQRKLVAEVNRDHNVDPQRFRFYEDIF